MVQCEDGIWREDWRAVVGPEDGLGFDDVCSEPRALTVRTARRKADDKPFKAKVRKVKHA